MATDSATPSNSAICCVTDDNVADVARSAETMSAKASVLSAVNWSDRVAPATKSVAPKQRSREVGLDDGEGGDRERRGEAVQRSVLVGSRSGA